MAAPAQGMAQAMAHATAYAAVPRTRTGARPKVQSAAERLEEGRKAIAAESRRRIEEALAKRLGGPVRPFIGHDALGAGTPVPEVPAGVLAASRRDA